MHIHRQATAMVAAAVAIVLAIFAAAQVRDAKAVLPPGNTVAQWNKIAEDTVVGSGAFQNESFIYMAYTTQAMYEAISPGERKGQSADAAVIGAASTVLRTTSRLKQARSRRCVRKPLPPCRTTRQPRSASATAT